MDIDDDKIEPFRRMFCAHYPRLVRLAVQMTGDEDEARDIVSDVMETAWRRFGDIDQSRQAAWLRTCVHNACVLRLKHRDVERRHSAALAAVLQPVTEAESRERELIFECSRKWDLIRFNQIDQKISSLNKSGVDRSDIERVLGKEAADKIHDNYLIFPSDAYLKIGIPTLVDNWEAYKIWLPISEEQRGVNKSLTKNYGW